METGYDFKKLFSLGMLTKNWLPILHHFKLKIN
jgi:hypothetical protein